MKGLLIAAGSGPAAPAGASDLPVTSDPIVLALRPAGRRVVRRQVGGSASTDETIAAAATAATAAALNEPLAGSLSWDGAGPDYRGDVVIEPGEYNESLGGSAWINLIGGTGNPDDVLIWANGDGAGGTFHSYGSAYLEGITFAARARSGDGYSPKYPWHITGGEQITAVNCVFDTTQANPNTPGHGTAGLVGMDGSSGAVVVFYGCKFKAGDASGFNLHGTGNGAQLDAPITWAFIDCDFEGVSLVSAGGGSVAGGQRNSMYVIGCTGVTAISANDNTDLYTDSSAPATAGGTVYRGVTVWPKPELGLSDRWQDHFYPSKIGQATTFTPAVTDAAAFTPPAGRLYVTRLKLAYAMRGKKTILTGAAAGGQYKAAAFPADTLYDRNLPPSPSTALTVDQPFAAGENASSYYYWYTRYPGDNGWWVYSKFDGSASVMGSVQLGQAESFYTDDGTTFVPVPAGMRVPHVGLRDSI